MHEFSLVRALKDAVLDRLPENTRTVRGISVSIGPGIVPESLRAAFQAETGGTALANTRLNIEPFASACPHCGTEIREIDAACPQCGSRTAGFVDRDAIVLRSIEVEDDE